MRDQHEAKKQFRASFLKKTCPGEDIAGFAIDSEVEQRLEAVQKQKEVEEEEALSKIDASQFALASPGEYNKVPPSTSFEENCVMRPHLCYYYESSS